MTRGPWHKSFSHSKLPPHQLFTCAGCNTPAISIHYMKTVQKYFYRLACASQLLVSHSYIDKEKQISSAHPSGGHWREHRVK